MSAVGFEPTTPEYPISLHLQQSCFPGTALSANVDGHEVLEHDAGDDLLTGVAVEHQLHNETKTFKILLKTKIVTKQF